MNPKGDRVDSEASNEIRMEQTALVVAVAGLEVKILYTQKPELIYSSGFHRDYHAVWSLFQKGL